MKKIRNIFNTWGRKRNQFKEVAILGSTRIIQLPSGEYQALGGTAEDRLLLHQYISINLEDSNLLEVSRRKTGKLFLLLESLTGSH
jgi:hypothetical protein